MEVLDTNRQEVLILKTEENWLSKSCKLINQKGVEVAFMKRNKFLFSKVSSKVYSNQSKEKLLGIINPTLNLDVNHHFKMYDNNAQIIGSLERKFITSTLWRTRYEFSPFSNANSFTIIEENPWIRISNFF